MDDTQTVVTEPNAQVMPEAEVVNDAQEEKIDLDSILKEFEEVKQVEEPKVTENKSDDEELKEWVRIQKARTQEEDSLRSAEEYKNTIKEIKGDLPLPDSMVDGYLTVRARDDQRIGMAYHYRNTHPKAWKAVVDDVRRELKNAIKNAPDTALTSTRSQVAEAIQNAKSTSSEIVEKPTSEMSDYEFEIYLNRFKNS